MSRRLTVEAEKVGSRGDHCEWTNVKREVIKRPKCEGQATGECCKVMVHKGWVSERVPGGLSSFMLFRDKYRSGDIGAIFTTHGRH
jgi:hypothetical protein